jgi:hypothetical protein
MTTICKRIISSAASPAWLAAVMFLLGSSVAAGDGDPIPLKEAKLIIEHNATAEDTGFQGFIDSEGWDLLELAGPNGVVLRLEGEGALGELGLTELFFETVEPENADVPIDELLADFPEGEYTFRGREMIDGESSGETAGTARLSHEIPDGPALLSPAEGATVPVADLGIRWGAVTQSIHGEPVKIIAYQLIVEKDVEPHPRMIGKLGLSMYLPATVTSMTIPAAFLEPATTYLWEVLAIADSGNQTLSSSAFKTE